MHACACAHTHTHTHTCIHVHTLTHTPLPPHLHAYPHAAVTSTHTRTHARTRARAYTHTQAQTNTNTHTHVDTFRLHNDAFLFVFVLCVLLASSFNLYNYIWEEEENSAIISLHIYWSLTTCPKFIQTAFRTGEIQFCFAKVIDTVLICRMSLWCRFSHFAFDDAKCHVFQTFIYSRWIGEILGYVTWFERVCFVLFLYHTCKTVCV